MKRLLFAADERPLLGADEFPVIPPRLALADFVLITVGVMLPLAPFAERR